MTTSAKEHVEAIVGTATAADLKKKVRQVAREYPIWTAVGEKLQVGPRDADLMARLNY